MGGVQGITQLLLKWSDGDSSARDELIPLVYEELRRLARGYLRRERNNWTLQPTALVNEAYLRLVNQDKVDFDNRAQFFGLCARIMRNILVDHARKKRIQPLPVSLSKADRINSRPDVHLLALDEALNKLEVTKPRHALIVELKFFGGLTTEQIAKMLGVSHATVERDWSYARAWLKDELGR